MSFLWRVSGLSLTDGVRCSDIQREFGAELLLLGVKKSVLGSPRGGLESVAGEKEAWNTLLRSLPPRPDLLINGGKWTDGHSANWTSWPA